MYYQYNSKENCDKHNFMLNNGGLGGGEQEQKMIYLGKRGKFNSIDNFSFSPSVVGMLACFIILYIYIIYTVHIYNIHIIILFTSFLSVEYFMIKLLFNKKESLLLYYHHSNMCFSLFLGKYMITDSLT